MKRCVHCLNYFKKLTKDHVFPSSWYPDNTPSSIQKWTTPTCKECNERLGKMEKEAIIIFGLCISKDKIGAKGLYEKAKRSLGIGINIENQKEARLRLALKKKIKRRIERYRPDVRTLPGLGLHSEFPAEGQMMIKGYEKELKTITKKIIRGLEYKLGMGYIEKNNQFETYFPTEEDAQELERLFKKAGRIIHGPGFIIQRGTAIDDDRMVIYKVEMWETIKLYASILPKNKIV